LSSKIQINQLLFDDTSYSFNINQIKKIGSLHKFFPHKNYNLGYFAKHLPSLTCMCEVNFTTPPNFQDLIQLNELKIIRSSYITERYGICLNDEGNLSIYTELMESSLNAYRKSAKQGKVDNQCKSCSHNIIFNIGMVLVFLSRSIFLLKLHHSNRASFQPNLAVKIKKFFQICVSHIRKSPSAKISRF
jgi:hypothetical protein